MLNTIVHLRSLGSKNRVSRPINWSNFRLELRQLDGTMFREEQRKRVNLERKIWRSRDTLHSFSLSLSLSSKTIHCIVSDTVVVDCASSNSYSALCSFTHFTIHSFSKLLVYRDNWRTLAYIHTHTNTHTQSYIRKKSIHTKRTQTRAHFLHFPLTASSRLATFSKENTLPPFFLLSLPARSILVLPPASNFLPFHICDPL